MEVYILDSWFEKIGYIDHAESVLWIKRYNDVGECELYLPADEEYMTMIMNGKYIYREDDCDMLCEIKSVEIETDVENGDYIIVTGKDVKDKLAGRIVLNEITYSGSVAYFIKKLLIDNVMYPTIDRRRIYNFTFKDVDYYDFYETITIKTSNEDLLELIKTTCKAYNYGFRVKYINDTKTLQFELFKGVNKASYDSDTYVEFSPEYANIISSRYKEDTTNYKNVCYVSYKDNNDVVNLMSVYNTSREPSDEERKEIYVDGTNVNREITLEELKDMYPEVTLSGSSYYYYDEIVANVNGDKIIVTDSTYLMLIETLGLNALSSYTKTIEFEGEVDSINNYEYKKDYDLGDIVKVVNEYGIEAQAMITEIMESDDNEDGYVVEPRFTYVEQNVRYE